MAVDIICDESELSITLNKVERYLEFLSSSISEYSEIVGSIPGGGLIDEKITAQLFVLSQMVSLEGAILSGKFGQMSNAVKAQINGMEEIDKFNYPDLSFQDILALLASFL